MTAPSPALASGTTTRTRPPAHPERGTATVRRLVGRYHHDRHTGTWSWSPETARLLGLPPSGVQPCLELLVGSLRPADRPRALDAVAAACTAGAPFALQVQLDGPGRDGRAAVLVGEPVADASGAIGALDGVLVEIPEEPRPPARPEPAGTPEDRVLALETEVAQLRTAMTSRAAIEQAKGILMLLTNRGEQVAFDLLAHISSNSHRKVRDVAVAIVESAAGRSALPEDIRTLVRDVCPPRRHP